MSKLIELFSAMGCTLGELPQPVHDASRSWRVRYLYSPETDDFISLSDLEDDESIASSEVQNRERRLGAVIPKGGSN